MENPISDSSASQLQDSLSSLAQHLDQIDHDYSQFPIPSFARGASKEVYGVNVVRALAS